MKESIDPRRLPAITKYIEMLKEDTLHIRISETIPFDTPVFISVEDYVDKLNRYKGTYLVSIKDMDKDSLIVNILAIEIVNIFSNSILTTSQDEFKFIPISCIKEWREWTSKEAPLTISYQFLSDAYKAFAFM
jgi:hypothetical protein